MSGCLAVVFPGAMASLQDLGRTGLRKVGVPRAGALEASWLRLANVLAGNEENAAAIEFFAGGLVLRAESTPIRLALAGHFAAEIVDVDGVRRSVCAWRSLRLQPGEQLRCGMTTTTRVGYVAVSGLEAPSLLGSASTYARAGFGRLLAAGDVLSVAAAGVDADLELPEPPPIEHAPIRVVLGPQSDYFADEAIAAFLSAEFAVTAESDRMGMRLDGAILVHRPEKGVEIVSDATVPGSIQVPGNGRPIVLLNDAQTAGGYPKIATVISADLPRLAVLPAGGALRFEAVSVVAAESAARCREAEVKALMESLRSRSDPDRFNPELLYGANLVSGMVDALCPESSASMAAPAGQRGWRSKN